MARMHVVKHQEDVIYNQPETMHRLLRRDLPSVMQARCCSPPPQVILTYSNCSVLLRKNNIRKGVVTNQYYAPGSCINRPPLQLWKE